MQVGPRDGNYGLFDKYTAQNPFRIDFFLHFPPCTLPHTNLCHCPLALVRSECIFKNTFHDIGNTSLVAMDLDSVAWGLRVHFLNYWQASIDKPFTIPKLQCLIILQSLLKGRGYLKSSCMALSIRDNQNMSFSLNLLCPRLQRILTCSLALLTVGGITAAEEPPEIPVGPSPRVLGIWP